MNLAIETMRQSVDEPRADNKAAPKVGTVLRKPDGTIETAYRGELRQGDHAEFTLLERKNRGSKLDGSILFATLEPFAPDARNAPKLGCAERIVLARIKEVWVGIEDPDPNVDRKGIKHLQDAGIQVKMFDRDLQEIIRDENKEFLRQAIERAGAASEENLKQVTLSTLEETPDATRDDLSKDALEAYRSIAKIDNTVDSPEFLSRLLRLGVLKQEGAILAPTGFGLLLFGKDPRMAMPQAGLLATIHYPDDAVEVRDFVGPQVLVPEQALQWLSDKLPNLISRSDARRRETNHALFELVREGIINALVHRDYDIIGAKCQLIVTPDKIVIMSPGVPVAPITLEQMQSFSAPMLSRNPIMHYLFAVMEMAEERGLGLKSMKRRAEETGLPLPKYVWEAPYMVLTLYQSAIGAVRDIPVVVLSSLNVDEQRGYELLTRKGAITRKEYATEMNFDSRKAQRHLKHFLEMGLLRVEGAGPATTYVLSRL